MTCTVVIACGRLRVHTELDLHDAHVFTHLVPAHRPHVAHEVFALHFQEWIARIDFDHQIAYRGLSLVLDTDTQLDNIACCGRVGVLVDQADADIATTHHDS